MNLKPSKKTFTGAVNSTGGEELTMVCLHFCYLVQE